MHLCGYCEDRDAEYTYETEGRGWKFLCERCYDECTPLLQGFCVIYVPTRYYPTFNYTTRVVE